MIVDGNKLIPDEGKWLYNGEVCSGLVYLGKNTSEDDWQEVDHYINTEPIEEVNEAYTAEQLADMTTAELKAICTELGIATSMVKQNMIDLILGKQNNLTG